MAFLRAPIIAFAIAGLLAGCSVPGPGASPDGVHDPYEGVNRQVHALNVGLDRVALRPASKVYGVAVPGPLKQGVVNVADTLDTPRSVVNQVLQGDLVGAGRNTLRFTTNAILGFGGLLDPATDLGMPQDKTDFGETLHVWGFPEGAFVMLPALGPSTERDAVGEVVDIVMNPLDLIFSDDTNRAVTGVQIAEIVGDRAALGDTVDSILYESADSYSQLRLIYLQSRRFELGQEAPEAAVEEFDPLALDTEGF